MLFSSSNHLNDSFVPNFLIAECLIFFQTRNYVRQCECSDGFYGYICQHRKFYCDEVTCYNGGKCEMGNHGGVCNCFPNSTGMFCETALDACISNPCNNGKLSVLRHFLSEYN